MNLNDAGLPVESPPDPGDVAQAKRLQIGIVVLSLAISALTVFGHWAAGYRVSFAAEMKLASSLGFFWQVIAAPALPICLLRLRTTQSVFITVAAIALMLAGIGFSLTHDAWAFALGRDQVEREIGGFDHLETVCRNLIKERVAADAGFHAVRLEPQEWPPEIQRLRPRWVVVKYNQVQIEFGSGFDHWGYHFRDEDLIGRGNRNLTRY